jgi:two-component system sensor histidine kinase UhpB
MDDCGHVKPSLNLPLYSKVCLINGVLFVAAATVLVISPATVSSQVTEDEVAVLACGLLVILAANALLLRGVLAPLDRLTQRMDRFDIGTPGERLPERGDPVAASLARSFNALLDRLELERAEGNARALAAQENERRRIAQELHDEVGQSLTVVLLGTTRALDMGPAEAEQELALVRDSARSSLDEVRRIVRGLRPGVLDDLGLITALRAMADEFGAHFKADVRQHLPHQLPAMSSHTELVIFRVAQEALTNVSRHAAASTVDLRLLTDASAVTLSVIDDGEGIDSTVNGEGIRGMRERALAVGGALRILPAPGGGTEVSLRVPVAARTR